MDTFYYNGLLKSNGTEPSSDTQGQIVEARESLNDGYYSSRNFFPPV